MITKILVPSDFGESSAGALDYAKSLAGTYNASLHLLHVVHDPIGRPAGGDALGVPIERLIAQATDEAERGFAAAMSPGEQAKFRAQTAVEVGSPVNKIVEYAQAQDIDLIVMGTHGRGALAHAILGSVAERVVRFAPCPVLTVRQQ